MDKIVDDLLLRPDMLLERPEMPVGTARLHPASRTLSGPHGSQTLEPRVVQLLVALIDAGGDVITRGMIEARCWGVTVSEDSINQLVASLRRASRATGGFRIETIPRTGYRLVADESEYETAFGPRDAKSRVHVTRRWLLLGGGAVIAGGAGAMLYKATRPDPRSRLADSLVAEAEQLLALAIPEKEKDALGLLERAANLQPDRADLWGKLALARARSFEHAAPDSDIPPAVRVLDPARRALSLDPNDIDAKAAMAILPPYYGDWLAAEQRFDAVLRQDPDNLPILESKSFLFGAVGRMKESATIRLGFADRMQFDAAAQARLGYAYWFLGRIGDADRVLARAAELWPGNLTVWMLRFFVLAGTGRADRALAHATDPAGRPQLPPAAFQTFRLTGEALVSGVAADKGRAVDAVVSGIADSPIRVINALMMLNLMQAMDEAFAVADAYFLERGPLIAALRWRPGGELIVDQRRRKTNPLFVPSSWPMRQDSRFEPLMAEMGLDRYWAESGRQPDYRSG